MNKLHQIVQNCYPSKKVNLGSDNRVAIFISASVPPTTIHHLVTSSCHDTHHGALSGGSQHGSHLPSALSEMAIWERLQRRNTDCQLMETTWCIFPHLHVNFRLTLCVPLDNQGSKQKGKWANLGKNLILINFLPAIFMWANIWNAVSRNGLKNGHRQAPRMSNPGAPPALTPGSFKLIDTSPCDLFCSQLCQV